LPRRSAMERGLTSDMPARVLEGARRAAAEVDELPEAHVRLAHVAEDLVRLARGLVVDGEERPPEVAHHPGNGREHLRAVEHLDGLLEALQILEDVAVLQRRAVVLEERGG